MKLLFYNELDSFSQQATNNKGNRNYYSTKSGKSMEAFTECEEYIIMIVYSYTIHSSKTSSFRCINQQCTLRMEWNNLYIKPSSLLYVNLEILYELLLEEDFPGCALG